MRLLTTIIFLLFCAPSFAEEVYVYRFPSKTPVKVYDTVSTDSQIASTVTDDAWLQDADQTLLTGDKSGSFDLVTSGMGEFNNLRLVSDIYTMYFEIGGDNKYYWYGDFSDFIINSQASFGASVYVGGSVGGQSWAGPGGNVYLYGGAGGGAGGVGNANGGDVTLYGGAPQNAGVAGSVIITGKFNPSGITGNVDWGSNNLTTTGVINCPEIYNSAGSLKIMPDVQGNVDCFGDTDVANDANGKSLSVTRRAAEGDTTLSIYGRADQYAVIDANWDMEINSNVASGRIKLGAVSTNIVNLLGSTENSVGWGNGTGNLVWKHYGYITAGGLSGQRYIQYQVDDTDDYYWLTGQASILGFKIDMPVDLIDNNLTTTGAVTVASNIKGLPFHIYKTIIDPLSVQTEDNEICLVPETDAALTITNIRVTLDATTNEVAGDLKFADAFIGLANATVVETFDTTSGVRSDDTMSGDATIPSGKCIYLSFDSAPNTAIKQMCIEIRGDYD